ncbi:hypothetical protein OPT61_g10138 [Boeremia exigua]|uniref:Uncharacterized protein n=1 Tax=Boeremia exigua TaxID=749465 RepID=A0ACC2HQZ9_9PLEO|nr:hypothetical protein OPT61_g10138 [Boeremia exigua]
MNQANNDWPSELFYDLVEDDWSVHEDPQSYGTYRSRATRYGCFSNSSIVFQVNAETLDINVNQTQGHSSWSPSWLGGSTAVAPCKHTLQESATKAHDNTAHVLASDHQSVSLISCHDIRTDSSACRSNSTAYATLAQNCATTAASGEVNADTTSVTQSSVDEPLNSEIICSTYRQKGSDDMSFECLVCRRRRKYNRWPDFLRHYNGAHAVERKVFWCPKDGCARSKANGNNPFPRKDKMNDHLRQAHSDERSL